MSNLAQATTQTWHDRSQHAVGSKYLILGIHQTKTKIKSILREYFYMFMICSCILNGIASDYECFDINELPIIGIPILVYTTLLFVYLNVKSLILINSKQVTFYLSMAFRQTNDTTLRTVEYVVLRFITYQAKIHPLGFQILSYNLAKPGKNLQIRPFVSEIPKYRSKKGLLL